MTPNTGKRVVITGMGVVAPNAIGLSAFEQALRAGRSGIRHLPELEKLGFACQVGGIPLVTDDMKARYLSELEMKRLTSTGILYGIMAATDAWVDAGFAQPDAASDTDWDAGCIFGTGMSGVQTFRDGVYKVDAGEVRRLGTTVVEQIMPSGISAHLSGRFALGNYVSTNATACSTGSEAILLAANHIRAGRARTMLTGSCDAGGPYVWAGFDSMRVLNRKMNDTPEQASRPMSETAAGFVPGCGSGAMVLEELHSAKARGAHIYAEVLGGAANSGGQRMGGSMTAPNPEGVKRCIAAALLDAGVDAQQISAISGHLTATMGDPLEIAAWATVLQRGGSDFPLINSVKSMIGHCLSAAGSIEMVAVALQLAHGFVHPSMNAENLHPRIAEMIDRARVPQKLIETNDLQVIAKASFGFGDVNSCVLLGKYHNN